MRKSSLWNGQEEWLSGLHRTDMTAPSSYLILKSGREDKVLAEI
jgi:hypothetical protein